jgi:nitrite reductase/ring-hydroxylating ferredoxin subunit
MTQDGRRAGMTRDHRRAGKADYDGRARSPAGPLLCRLGDIPDGAGKGFWFGGGTTRFGLFLVRQGDAVFAYVNSCPHRNTPLDWLPDRFLDRSGRHLLCATHGALFRIVDGFCLSGPCAGARLQTVATLRRGAEIYLDETLPDPFAPPSAGS